MTEEETTVTTTTDRPWADLPNPDAITRIVETAQHLTPDQTERLAHAWRTAPGGRDWSLALLTAAGTADARPHSAVAAAITAATGHPPGRPMHRYTWYHEEPDESAARLAIRDAILAIAAHGLPPDQTTALLAPWATVIGDPREATP